ncbi:MAG: YcxB family protein [Acidimicrobiales bacterium]|jgi:hypothetical protein
MEDVIVESQWERKEFLHAQRRAVRFSYVDFVIFGIILVGLVVLQYFFWLGVAFAVFLVAYYLVLPITRWNVGVGVEEPRRTIVNDEGISIESSSFCVKLVWSRFKKSTETSEFYFLISKKGNSTTIVRKRTFASDYDQARFRAFLLDHTNAQLRTNRQLDDLIT